MQINVILSSVISHTTEQQLTRKAHPTLLERQTTPTHGSTSRPLRSVGSARRGRGEDRCRHASVVHHRVAKQYNRIQKGICYSSGAFCLSHSCLSLSQFGKTHVLPSVSPRRCSASTRPASTRPTWLYRGGRSQLHVQSGASELSRLYRGGARLASTSTPSTPSTPSSTTSNRLPWDSTQYGRFNSFVLLGQGLLSLEAPIPGQMLETHPRIVNNNTFGLPNERTVCKKLYLYWLFIQKHFPVLHKVSTLLERKSYLIHLIFFSIAIVIICATVIQLHKRIHFC